MPLQLNHFRVFCVTAYAEKDGRVIAFCWYDPNAHLFVSDRRKALAGLCAYRINSSEAQALSGFYHSEENQNVLQELHRVQADDALFDEWRLKLMRETA